MREKKMIYKICWLYKNGNFYLFKTIVKVKRKWQWNVIKLEGYVFLKEDKVF